jgi:hypothetical protein
MKEIHIASRSSEFDFTNVLSLLLESYGYQVIREPDTSVQQKTRYRADLLALGKDEGFLIEIKGYRYKKAGGALLRRAAELLSKCELVGYPLNDGHYLGVSYGKIRKVIVTPFDYSNKDELLSGFQDVELWGPADLKGRFPVDGNFPFDFGDADVVSNVVLGKSYEKETQESEDLINHLRSIKSGEKWFSDFEDCCINILKYLFNGPLQGWHEQQSTKDGLNRYDFICRISSGISDGQTDFWSNLASDFRTRYIIFECKNYSKKIKQGQIYTTEKYLFARALRTVAVILTRTGVDENALRASYGVLRETGKLLLVLSDDDLESMLRLKARGDDPTEVLFEKLDNLLMGLPK